jgi:hypothetical protein
VFIRTGEAIAARVYPGALKREVDAAFAYALLGVKL